MTVEPLDDGIEVNHADHRIPQGQPMLFRIAAESLWVLKDDGDVSVRQHSVLLRPLGPDQVRGSPVETNSEGMVLPRSTFRSWRVCGGTGA